MISYIQFIPGVSATIGTRDTSSINGYVATKHAKDIDVERHPGGIYLWIKEGGKRTGRRVDVCNAAIATISETIEAPAGKKP